MPSQRFMQLFATYELFAFERQFALPQVVRGDWRFDMTQGRITFTSGEESVSVSVQILGTESQGTGTWLWSWANQGSNVPAELLQVAADLLHLPSALGGYAEKYELELERSEAELVVRSAEGQVTVSLDDQGRFAGLEAQLQVWRYPWH